MAKEFSQVIDVEGIEAFDDYITYYRDGQELSGTYTKKQGDRGTYFKLKGSFVPVADVFDNMETWIRTGVRRAVSNRTAINKVESSFKYLPNDIREISEAEKRADTPNVVSFSRIDEKTGKRQIKHYQYSSPYFAAAFGEQLGKLEIDGHQFLKNNSNFLRTNVVYYPLFGLTQLPMDAYNAMFSSGIRNPLMIPLRIMKEFPLTLLNMSETHKIGQRVGFTGTYNSFVQGETLSDNELKNQKGLYASMTRFINSVPGLGKDISLDRIGIETPISVKRLLERIAMSSDNAIRQAVYEQTMAETNDKGLAVNRMAEIINFKRAGANKTIAFLRGVVPFFGAFMQATAIQGRVLFGDGVSPQQRAFALAKYLNAGTQATVAALAYTLLMQDDDEYERLDPSTKDSKFIFPNGFHLRLRPDIHTLLWKIIPENVLNNMLGNSDNQKVADAIKRGLREAFLTNRMLPQAIRPIMDLSYNFDPRTQRDITTQSLKDLPAGEQFTKNTSEFAKFLSQKINLDELGVTPIQIDFFLRQYFGYTGGLATMLIDEILKDLGVFDVEPASKTERDLIASIPGMGSFISREYGNRHTSDFFELKKEVETAYQAYKKLIAEDYDTDKALDLYQDKAKLIDAKDEINTYMKVIKQIRKERNLLLRKPKDMISSDEKRKEYERLNRIEERTLNSILKVRQRVYGTMESPKLQEFLTEKGLLKKKN